ncbi:MAG: hypothetical protein RL213_260 [Bacteroidota bacterium]
MSGIAEGLRDAGCELRDAGCGMRKPTTNHYTLTACLTRSNANSSC